MQCQSLAEPLAVEPVEVLFLLDGRSWRRSGRYRRLPFVLQVSHLTPLSRSKSCFCWTDARGNDAEGVGIRRLHFFLGRASHLSSSLQNLVSPSSSTHGRHSPTDATRPPALRCGVGGGRWSLLPTARNFASRCTGSPRFRLAKSRGNTSSRIFFLSPSSTSSEVLVVTVDFKILDQDPTLVSFCHTHSLIDSNTILKRRPGPCAAIGLSRSSVSVSKKCLVSGWLHRIRP
jgi:hypothetical protein